MRAGDVLFMHRLTCHGSLPNVSNKSHTIWKGGERCCMVPEIDWLGKKTGRLTGGGSMIPSVRKKSSLNQKKLSSLNLPVFRKGPMRMQTGGACFESKTKFCRDVFR